MAEMGRSGNIACRLGAAQIDSGRNGYYLKLISLVLAVRNPESQVMFQVKLSTAEFVEHSEATGEALQIGSVYATSSRSEPAAS